MAEVLADRGCDVYIATGEVLTDLTRGHSGADVLRFFKQITPASLAA
jgi:hypothetical protein